MHYFLLAALTPGSFHPPAIPFDLLPEFFKALKQVLEQSVQRRVELNEQLRENADADEEDIEELQNELNSDNDLLMHVTDCIVRPIVYIPFDY